MGRKKGKQRGQYSSKARKAAYLNEFHQHVSDAHDELRRTSNWSNGCDKKNINKNKKSELAKLRDERGPVSLSLLRGMLREHVIEGREREASYRRQMLAGNNDNWRQIEQRTKRKDFDDATIGWILIYDYREAMAGIQQLEDSVCDKLLEDIVPKQNIPTLQQLCIQSLALHLQQYINACGEEYILNRLSLLPSSIISALSVSCRDVTDQMAYVMGKQSHVEALVLCAMSQTHKSDEMKENETLNHGGTICNRNEIHILNSRSNWNFTEDGLLSLIPSYNDEESITLDCWEENEIQDDQIILSSNQQQKHLKRLELRNFQTESGGGTNSMNCIIAFFQAHSHITHLSLCQSFNAISGPQLLLLDENNDCYDPNQKTNNFNDGTTILSILENLQVLDLSGCTWVHFDLLRLFLQRMLNKKSYHMSLQLIVVDQCCSYLNQGGCDILNRLTCGKPHLCTKVP